MYNYDQRNTMYGQPIEFLYARGIPPGMNGQPGIGGFVNGVRRQMHNINAIPEQHYQTEHYPVQTQMLQIGKQGKLNNNIIIIVL